MRRLGGILASLLLACLVTVGPTAPAQAATGPQQEICNSVNSVTSIKVWSTTGGSGFPSYLGLGACHTYPNDSNRLRVDVDPDFGPDDVDSYYIGQEGEGYGPCHDGENSASDPPNIDPQYVKYNTNRSGC
jgi:hypothetical protein